MNIDWKHEPDEHDYDAAHSYLSLVMSEYGAACWTADLCSTDTTVEHPAKDILRASGLPLLPKDNKHVAKDLRKIADGAKLSPVLLIAGTLGKHPLIIADGYHRICSAYHVDENAVIPARIANT
jgi:hypothetical protein